MHFLLPVSLCFAATAISDNLFLTDAPLDDPSLLWDDSDEFNTIGSLGGSDPSLSIANSDFSEIASCLGESSDLLSWSRLRAREEGGICSESAQPVPFKGALPGWTDDLGRTIKKVF